MTRNTLILASLGLFSLACNEYELVESEDFQDDLSSDAVPDIAVNPMVLNFGQVYVDGVDAPPAEVTEVVTVVNEGEGDLHIQDIYLSDANGPYEIGAISSVLVQPGGSAQFTVTFHPETATDSPGQVLIDSDDPDEATVEVQLMGEGIAPIISVSPTEHPFGSLYIGCEGEQPIEIENIGNAELIVDGFEYNTGSADLSFDSSDAEAAFGELPWSLQPEEVATVHVTYHPYDEYADSAYLFVDSNDPYTPRVMATQEGTGELYGTNADLYEQPLKGMTDIIFAVDRSCSMDDDIAAVQSNFGVFTTTMASLDADFHVAASVEDNGCINGSDLYIDNTFSASDASDTITTMINYGLSYGSNTERAFMMLESTLAEAVDSGGCNDGLLRDDATLNLVGVSDEPEQSVNNYSYYVSLFQSLKSDPDDVIFHAIGGDYPSGCGSASAYTGFYEATVATGGLFLSICATDWGSHLEALAEGSTADLSSFELTDWPVSETISVRIDGITTTVGWEYNATDNAIDFDSDYVPEGGSTIEIEYALYGDCDE
jgi:hypothetical protein